MNAKNFVTKHEHVINSYINYEQKKTTKHEHVNYSIMSKKIPLLIMNM